MSKPPKRRSTVVKHRVQALGVRVYRAMELDRGARRYVRLTVPDNTPPLPGEAFRESAKDYMWMSIPGKAWAYFPVEEVKR